ncbi:unnamed protein product, partial [Discosporangium mesarthrocarpum]
MRRLGGRLCNPAGAGAGHGNVLDSTGSGAGYMGGLMSSVGVWLGLKSMPLEGCLNSFFSVERLKGVNEYHCDSCDAKMEADKALSLLHAPEVLILHVKRFGRGMFWSHKLHSRVSFPLKDLDMSPWLVSALDDLSGGTSPDGMKGGYGG